MNVRLTKADAKEKAKNGAYLRNERPIFGAGHKVLGSVSRIARKHGRVHHGRVGELGAVATREHAPGELGLVDHGRHDESGAAEFLAPKLVAVDFHAFCFLLSIIAFLKKQY